MPRTTLLGSTSNHARVIGLRIWVMTVLGLTNQGDLRIFMYSRGMVRGKKRPATTETRINGVSM